MNEIGKLVLTWLILYLASSKALQFENNQQVTQSSSNAPSGSERNGKNLLDFVGLGTGQNIDPFMARTNNKCLNGDLSECFKSQALNTFNDFFGKDVYSLTPHVRVVRLPEDQVRSLEYEPFEYSDESRQSDSEWDQLIKFGLRKAEKFMKSYAIEAHIPDEVTEGGRYSPRFFDEISDEIDVIEDKKAPLLIKHRLKKIFIPMLIILKLFKLKLLLFLPFILGLAGFKKILGLAALIIPGIIGYFKLCRPNAPSSFGNIFSDGHTPQYSAQGLGGASYNPLYSKNPNQYRPDPNFASPYNNYYRDSGVQQPDTSNIGVGSSGVRFGEEDVYTGQDLAYQGYSEYRNKKVEEGN